MKKPVMIKVKSISTKMQQNTTGQGPWPRLCGWTLHTLNWLCLISHNWRPFGNIMTSSNGMTSRVTALCVGNSPGTGEFPSQRTVTRRFDFFFDLRLTKRLSKKSWCWRFETPSHSLSRHCNELVAPNLATPPAYIHVHIWQKIYHSWDSYTCSHSQQVY